VPWSVTTIHICLSLNLYNVLLGKSKAVLNHDDIRLLPFDSPFPSDLFMPLYPSWSWRTSLCPRRGPCESCTLQRNHRQPDAVEKPRPKAIYTFRQGEAAGCTGSLPAYFQRRNCLIMINTLDNSLIASGSWKTLRAQAQMLVDTCAGSNNGAGGHILMANGLYIALWAPRSYVAMTLSTGGTVPACVSHVESNGVDWNAALTQKLRRRNESSETD